ncbi:MAG: hypothetical protein IPL03_13585 [Sterolibacteriaceae bacterium]|nr:hypothetical protein [Candidatus Methylophosphatis haderslevensis]
MREVVFAGLLTVAIFGGVVMSDIALAVDLRASVAGQSDREITLQYALENSTGGRIYAFDLPLYFDSKGATKLAETAAYVFLDGERTARIVRGILAPPMFMSVSRRPPIVASAIESGASKSGTIKLALPLSEANPYFPTQECDPKSARPIARLLLQIGWVEHRQNTVTAKAVIDAKELVRLTGGWGAPLQRVAQAEVAVRDVGLCPYSGQFDRAQLRQ